MARLRRADRRRPLRRAQEAGAKGRRPKARVIHLPRLQLPLAEGERGISRAASAVRSVLFVGQDRPGDRGRPHHPAQGRRQAVLGLGQLAGFMQAVPRPQDRRRRESGLNRILDIAKNFVDNGRGNPLGIKGMGAYRNIGMWFCLDRGVDAPQHSALFRPGVKTLKLSMK
jgi:hypothetical protein